MVNIALDAMGGDHAPKEIVAGALEALQTLPVKIYLVGDSEKIKAELTSQGAGESAQLEIVHADQEIGMGESPAQAYKQKKNSSIHVGLNWVKEGKADAFVSAGNTGAVMMVSTFTLGRIKGVERPAIGTVLPTMDGRVVMLDMGSNVDCKSQHLVQFAMMGDCFCRSILHIENPRIGLLNIGEERDKGDDVSQASYPLLEKAPINFVGNIESKEILFDKADVIVCDGFVGNNILKFAEGVVEFFMKYFKRACKKSLRSMLGAWLLMPTIKEFKRNTDWEEFGGAPLLGVNGVSIIAHGKSHAKAIKNAILIANESVKTGMVDKIAGKIQE